VFSASSNYYRFVSPRAAASLCGVVGVERACRPVRNSELNPRLLGGNAKWATQARRLGA
jgi:hypothetical protein